MLFFFSYVSSREAAQESATVWTIRLLKQNSILDAPLAQTHVPEVDQTLFVRLLILSVGRDVEIMFL